MYAAKDSLQTTDESYKTPMWLINQLANHNRLRHEYKLEKEEGHYKTKRFTMSLHMGEEIWGGSGTTKKEAKRNAAEMALQGTTLPHPPPDVLKKGVVNQNALTATVKLNGMAMGLGKEVVYTVVGKKYTPLTNNIHTNHWNAQQLQHHQQQHILGTRFVSQDVRQQANPSIINAIGGAPQSWYTGNVETKGTHPATSFKYYQGPCKFTVCVTVGEDKFYGEGSTQQMARHDAAGRAIAFLQSLPVQPKPVPPQSSENGYRKSFVSILYEESLPRDMNVVFKTTDENGPPHLKHYTLEVTVGFYAEGVLDQSRPFYQAVASGSSKKAAKQNVAACVLEKMTDLPPRVKGKKKPKKESEQPIGPQEAQNLTPPHLHPVSLLIQYSQARKTQEPKYTLLEQDEASITPETKFSYQCVLQEKTVTGFGRCKKDAKKNAATAMLNYIEYLPIAQQSVRNLNMIPQKTSMKQKPEDTQVSDPAAKHLQVQFIENPMVNRRPQEFVVPASYS